MAGRYSISTIAIRGISRPSISIARSASNSAVHHRCDRGDEQAAEGEQVQREAEAGREPPRHREDDPEHRARWSLKFRFRQPPAGRSSRHRALRKPPWGCGLVLHPVRVASPAIEAQCYWSFKRTVTVLDGCGSRCSPCIGVARTAMTNARRRAGGAEPEQRVYPNWFVQRRSELNRHQWPRLSRGASCLGWSWALADGH